MQQRHRHELRPGPRSGLPPRLGLHHRYGRMVRRQRVWIYSILGLLWLTGILWLLLDQFFAKRGEFGVTPHPLETPLLLFHGIVAVVSMYLFGWIAARHVTRWWAAKRRRLSGSALTAVLAALSISGFALFFLVDDAAMHVAALIHDGLGLAAVVFGVQHWFFRVPNAPSETTE